MSENVNLDTCSAQRVHQHRVVSNFGDRQTGEREAVDTRRNGCVDSHACAYILLARLSSDIPAITTNPGKEAKQLLS